MTASRFGTITAALVLHAITLDMGAAPPGHAQQKKSTRAAPPIVLGVSEPRPRVALLRDGRLIGAFTISKTPEIAARYSSDNGRSWSEPQTLVKLPTAGSWGGPEVLVDDRGEVHLFFLNVGQEFAKQSLEQRRIDIWYAKSADGRTVWSSPKRVWEGYTGSLNSVTQLRNGRLVLPFSYLTDRSWRKRGEGLFSFTYSGKFDSTVIYSDDRGETWRQSPAALRVPTPDITTILGAIEPVVIELTDGRVWMLIRTQMGRFYESFSPDGIAWSRPKPSGIVSSDSPAGVVRLQDGRLVLLWNNCLRFPYAYGGRHVLHAAISRDEGKTWRGFREVARDKRRNEPPPPSGDHGTGYPFPALTKDGKVLFSSGQGEGGKFHALLDPEWLYETVQSEDFSRGVEDWSIFGTRGVALSPHPQKTGAQVLALRKPEADWPAAAVWNFPAGARGQVRLRILLQPGFSSANIGLTDHFSVPFDELDQYYNLYNLKVGLGTGPAGGVGLTPNRWHDLVLDWDCAARRCRVLVDGKEVAVLPQDRTGAMASYLRVRSTADEVDNAGLVIESVSADVSRSW